MAPGAKCGMTFPTPGMGPPNPFRRTPLVRRWHMSSDFPRREMAETKTETDAVGGREHPDKSPLAVEAAHAEAEAADKPKPGQRAETSNLDIVRFYFNAA